MKFETPLIPSITRVLVALVPAIDASPGSARTHAALLADLDAGKRADASRLRFAADRATQVAAHALLRRALSALAERQGRQVAPPDWRFGRGPHGKLHLLAGQWPASLELNLSHTRGLVAVALREGAPVGIDVECADRPLHDGPGLARHCYTARERDWLEAAGMAGGAWWRQRFFQLWTAKEAFIKGLGLGLSRDLQSFSVDPNAGRVHHEPDARPEPHWRLHRWHVHGQPLALAEAAPWGGSPELLDVDLTRPGQSCPPHASASPASRCPR